jgi:hypothetical protein
VILDFSAANLISGPLPAVVPLARTWVVIAAHGVGGGAGTNVLQISKDGVTVRLKSVAAPAGTELPYILPLGPGWQISANTGGFFLAWELG